MSYAWGVLRLVQSRSYSNAGNNEWSFGQVIPVIILAAPLVTLFEYCSDYFWPGK